MKNKTNFYTTIGYIFVIILTIAKSVGLSANSKFYVGMFAFGAVLALLKVFKERFTKRELCLLIPLVVIGLLCYFVGKETTVLFTAIVLFSLKNIDIRKLIKIMLWIKIALFVTVVAMTFLGLIDGNIVTMWRQGDDFGRFAFIYGSPNIAHLELTTIIMMWIYVYYEKSGLLTIFLLGLINYVFFLFTLSRTGMLVGFFCIVLFVVYKKIEIIKKYINKRLALVFWVLFFLTITISLLYGKIDAIDILNKLFTGRIYYNNYFLTKIRLPLIGKSSYDNLLIDNGWISILYNGGILAFFWFAFMNTKVTSYLKKARLEKEIIIYVIMLFYALAESFYMNAVVNFSLLFYAYYIYSNNYSNKRSSGVIRREKR